MPKSIYNIIRKKGFEKIHKSLFSFLEEIQEGESRNWRDWSLNGVGWKNGEIGTGEQGWGGIGISLSIYLRVLILRTIHNYVSYNIYMPK